MCDAHKLWGWYLALGIAMIVAGGYAIYADVLATLASVIILGSVLFVAGIAQIVGVLDVIVGAMLWQHPDAGAYHGDHAAISELRFGRGKWRDHNGLGRSALDAMAGISFLVHRFSVGVNLIFGGAAWSSLALKLKAL